MELLDLADDILGIIADYIPAARKRKKVKFIKKAYIPTHAVLHCWRFSAPHRVRHLNLWTNGQELFSYALKIGFTEDTTKVLLNYTVTSITGVAITAIDTDATAITGMAACSAAVVFTRFIWSVK